MRLVILVRLSKISLQFSLDAPSAVYRQHVVLVVNSRGVGEFLRPKPGLHVVFRRRGYVRRAKTGEIFWKGVQGLQGAYADVYSLSPLNRLWPRRTVKNVNSRRHGRNLVSAPPGFGLLLTLLLSSSHIILI